MRKKTYSIILLFIAILAVWMAPRIVEEDAKRSEYEFVKVIDGDTLTIVYEGAEVNVRLIGVDAPESVHPDESRNTDGGVHAKEQLAQMLEGSKCVYLEFDAERYDTYGRLLAYVYLAEGGDFAEGVNFAESLNYRMVAEGYAVNKEYKPNVRYARELQTACEDAEASKRGLWEDGF